MPYNPHLMSRLLTTPSQLREYLANRGVEWQASGLSYLDTLAVPFPLRLSTYYADLIDWMNPADPLRLIAIPQENEEIIQENELSDPIGDGAREVLPGLIHRYPDRVLLLLTTQCRIHCRFCFRRDVVGSSTSVDLTLIENYLREHAEIQEVILSGGDPLSLPITTLRSALCIASSLDHIKRVRFHTRVPVVDPDAVSSAIMELFSGSSKQDVVVLHIDHPRELTNEVLAVIKRLREHGVLVTTQTVLLKGINADKETLLELFMSLVNNGVRPYYLHHLDQAMGTSHFRISIAEGLALYEKLTEQTSRLSLPEYVLDLPGGWGKVPVRLLRRVDETHYETTTFEGKTVVYQDPAGND